MIIRVAGGGARLLQLRRGRRLHVFSSTAVTSTSWSSCPPATQPYARLTVAAAAPACSTIVQVLLIGQRNVGITREGRGGSGRRRGAAGRKHSTDSVAGLAADHVRDH